MALLLHHPVAFVARDIFLEKLSDGQGNPRMESNARCRIHGHVQIQVAFNEININAAELHFKVIAAQKPPALLQGQGVFKPTFPR